MTYSRALTTLLLSASTVAFASTSMAQDILQDDVDRGDVVIATGIRQSLENALIEKREANSLIEVIFAEDIGKLPDQNLAEVLENITGIQITRTEGVGSAVQIRGTNLNLIQFNGVTTVGAGNGRGGIEALRMSIRRLFKVSKLSNRLKRVILKVPSVVRST